MLRIGLVRVLRSRHLAILASVSLLTLAACDEDENEKANKIRQINIDREALEQQIPRETIDEEDKPLAIVESLPSNESVEGLQSALPKLFFAIGRMPRSEFPDVYRALATLRAQRNIVEAITNHYRALPTEAFYERLRSLQVIGELQRPDAQTFLVDVIWRPLPAPDERPNLGERISAREYEEMVQSTAVKGLTFLRTPEGTPLPSAMAETLRVIQDHPSRLVKIAAIDAYMWNNGDAVASELYELLPEEFHKFVERPRLHRGANKSAFEARLKEWRDQWER